MTSARDYLNSAYAGLVKLAGVSDRDLELMSGALQDIDSDIYDLLEYDGPKETPPTDAEGEKERFERLTKDIPK
jgi:hypothetical protein